MSTGPHAGLAGLRRELDRLVHEVARRADEIVVRPEPTPRILHDLHRDLRHLRTGLRLWRGLLPRPRQEVVEALDRRLRRLAQLVGQVRDRDVAVALLGEVEAVARRRRDHERLDRYRSRLRDDARTGRELLRAMLRSERDLDLFGSLRRSLEEPVRAGAARVLLPRLLSEHRSEGHEKLEAAHRRACRRPSMNRLHRLRIRVRRLRQIVDLASSVDPAMAGSVPGSWRGLQQGLGRLHDLDVLLGRLEPDLRTTGWARALRKERRRQRRSVLGSLEDQRPPTLEAARRRARKGPGLPARGSS